MAANQESSCLTSHIEHRLAEFHRLWQPLAGLSGGDDLQQFVYLLADAAKASHSIGEHTDYPVLAEILNYRQRSATDEACWLLFLYCYLGRSNLLHAIHASWSWQKASADADAFSKWLISNQRRLKEAGTLSQVHKYRTFDQHSAKAMGEDAQAYIAWIKAAGGHARLFQHAVAHCQGQPMMAFDQLYLSMNQHASFKRQIKLDYLCLVGHLKMADIEPGQFYFSDVLSLKKAARQLFSGHPSAKMPLSELNELTVALATCLCYPFNIAVLYRALILWGEEKQAPVYPNFRRY